VSQKNQVLQTLARFLPLVYMCRNYLPLEILKLIYDSLVNPNLPYYITSLGNTPNVRVNLLQTIENTNLRALCRRPPRETTHPLLRLMHLLRVEEIYNCMIVNYVYKALNGMTLSYWFSLYNNVYITWSENNLILCVPFSNL